MSDDLIARLLDWDEYDEGHINDARQEAADEITRLRAEVMRLEGAVQVAHGYALMLSADLLQEKIAHNAAKDEVEGLREAVKTLEGGE